MTSIDFKGTPIGITPVEEGAKHTEYEIRFPAEEPFFIYMGDDGRWQSRENAHSELAVEIGELIEKDDL